jgi:hypothetical protein
MQLLQYRMVEQKKLLLYHINAQAGNEQNLIRYTIN